MYVIPNIPIEDLLLVGLTSRSYGTIIQHIGSAISGTPLFNNNSFSQLFKFICEDNCIRKMDIYNSLSMNNKTFYNHLDNISNSKIVAIDICVASGFDFALTMVLLALKGFILNPNIEEDYEIMEFLQSYDGTTEERLEDYIDWFRP